ncbi:co-chaperone protein p23-1-like [Nymphaea colorata]|nr:co-chaperone protein p23-1-like [Nymphaea colorata]
MSRHPSVKWAQRSDKVYITVELPDAKDVKHKLEAEGKFLFNATRDNVAYEVDLELFDKIDVEQSKANVGVRSIIYVIQKAEKKWWSRLVKQEGKPPAFLKVDWDKWVDEDDEKGGADMDFGDMDFSKLAMGGDDFDMDLPKDDEEENEGEEEETKEEPVSSATDEAKA